MKGGPLVNKCFSYVNLHARVTFRHCYPQTTQFGFNEKGSSAASGVCTAWAGGLVDRGWLGLEIFWARSAE